VVASGFTMGMVDRACSRTAAPAPAASVFTVRSRGSCQTSP
jgi:hypothetical protein